MAQLTDTIIKPLLTEKSSGETEKYNRYAFQVDRNSNKHQIKIAIEKLFDVKVLNVKTAVMPGKIKKFGRNVKKTNRTKKAYVQVEQGQKIELFKGI